MSQRPVVMGKKTASKNVDPITLYNFTFPAEQLAVRTALADIRTALEQALLDSALVGRVESALAELFNNIVKHAYANQGSGTLKCTVTKTAPGVVVNVIDHGKAMPGHTLPDGDLPNLEVGFSDLPEGGFGWFIIKSQTDGLSYERVGADNYTQLVFEVRRNA